MTITAPPEQSEQVPTRRPTTSGRMQKAGSQGILYVFMTVIAIAFLLPLIWMVVSSLKPEADVLSVPPSFWPHNPQWSNYSQVFDIIPRYFYNSVKLAVFNVIGVMAVAALAGYAFARLQFAGRNALFTALLSTAIVPGIIYLIPQYIIYSKIGWLDTHYPLWVPRVLTPVFPTFLMRQTFMTMPQALEDAARIDGANTFMIFLRVMLPQAKPSLAAIGMFTFLESWNDLFGPIIFISSPRLETLPVALAQFQGEYFSQVSLLMAAATVTVLPVLALYLLTQRYFIQGITMTGLRG